MFTSSTQNLALKPKVKLVNRQKLTEAEELFQHSTSSKNTFFPPCSPILKLSRLTPRGGKEGFPRSPKFSQEAEIDISFKIKKG